MAQTSDPSVGDSAGLSLHDLNNDLNIITRLVYSLSNEITLLQRVVARLEIQLTALKTDNE